MELGSINPKLQAKLPAVVQSNNDDDETTGFGDEDFADEDVPLVLPEGRQAASKRQPDDYGHMRYGKRDFDDYGHMRFGRRWRGTSYNNIKINEKGKELTHVVI